MSDEASISETYRAFVGLTPTLPKDKHGFIKGKYYTVSLNDEGMTIKTIFRPEIMQVGDKFTDVQTGYEATIQAVGESEYLQ